MSKFEELGFSTAEWEEWKELLKSKDGLGEKARQFLLVRTSVFVNELKQVAHLFVIGRTPPDLLNIIGVMEDQPDLVDALQKFLNEQGYDLKDIELKLEQYTSFTQRWGAIPVLNIKGEFVKFLDVVVCPITEAAPDPFEPKPYLARITVDLRASKKDLTTAFEDFITTKKINKGLAKRGRPTGHTPIEVDFYLATIPTSDDQVTATLLKQAYAKAGNKFDLNNANGALGLLRAWLEPRQIN